MVMLILMIFLGFVSMSFDSTIAWVVLGLLSLVGCLYMCIRQGMAIGREACAILKTVERAQSPENIMHNKLEKKYVSQSWSANRGLRAVFASALIPYLASSVYIILMLLELEPAATISRVVAWVFALPYWPIIAYWYPQFVELAPPIVMVLMLSPFIAPLCTYLGYMQGPKLWAKTEAAMVQGKRRAKAKSRIAQKNKPRVNKPEI